MTDNDRPSGLEETDENYEISAPDACRGDGSDGCPLCRSGIANEVERYRNKFRREIESAAPNYEERVIHVILAAQNLVKDEVKREEGLEARGRGRGSSPALSRLKRAIDSLRIGRTPH